jgi:hypothetical protein
MPNWLDGKPWFSHEVGKDFESGKTVVFLYYHLLGEEVSVICFFPLDVLDESGWEI